MSNSRPPDGGAAAKTPKKKKRSRRWLGYTLLILVGMMVGGAGLAGAYVYKAYQALPAFEEYDPSLTSVIFDRQGRKVYELADEENRTLVKLDEIPKEVQEAFIATEDRRFRDHHGIDFIRLGGAVFADVKYFLGVKGSQLEGASTITMQLARNAFLTLDQNVNRKVQEMLIAVDLEKRYSKDQILEQYLNQVSFGYRASGIEAASQTYFSKHASELTLSEGAMLAGMLKAPSENNPFDNYEGAMERRAIVLDLMVNQGRIDKARAEQIKLEQPEVKRAEVTPTSVTFNGDWYVDHVVNILTDAELSKKYGTRPFTAKDLYHGGLKIYTALDLDYQKVAQEQVQQIMPAATKEYGGTDVPQAAVVMLDHTNGNVLALVGGLEHTQMLGLNRATQAYRDPGSTIKPLVSYLPAIDALGWGPATIIDDSPPRLNEARNNVWPENYELHYNGLRNMRWAVEQSVNAMAVRTITAVTPKKAVEYAHKLGLESVAPQSAGPTNDENLALTLGGLSKGVTPLELASAYGTLGNLGTRVEPIVITKIENKHGEVIWEAPTKKTQAVSADSTWLMLDVMKGTVQRGTAYNETKGFKGWPAAGKTGTTEWSQDAWFAGTTPQITTIVWTGYDNDESRKTLPQAGWKKWTGAGPPVRIWNAIMREVIKEKPADWERPGGLVKVQVCKLTGKVPSPLCPADQITEDWFRKGFEPKGNDDMLTTAQVVKQPWEIPGTKQTIERYFLWQPGCAGTPETKLMIKRPTQWVMHPTNPGNIARYWPADWETELPTEKCKPSVPSTGPGNGTGTGAGNGTGTGNGTGAGNGSGTGNGTGGGNGTGNGTGTGSGNGTGNGSGTGSGTGGNNGTGNGNGTVTPPPILPTPPSNP